MLDLDAYFGRIGYSGSRAPTLATLREVHRRHPTAIPFETLDPLLGRPVRLDLDALERKLVAERRGGYCFEQNLLFGHALRALGFEVANLAARVVWEAGDHERRARTHMLLLVQVAQRRYLCDVGFGGLTLTTPLELTPDVEQRTSHETFRLRGDGGELSLEARLADDWKTLYRFDLQEQRQVDIEVLNYYVSTNPESPFLTRLMAARRTADGRYALRDNRLGTYGANGRLAERALGTVAELRGALVETFGINLPADSRLDTALDAVIERSRA